MSHLSSRQDLNCLLESADTGEVISEVGYISLESAAGVLDIPLDEISCLPSSVRAFIILVKAASDNALFHSHKRYKEISRKDFSSLTAAALRLKHRLETQGHAVFFDEIRNKIPAKELAAAAGLGRIGEHTLFISKRFGPAVQIVVLGTDLILEELRQGWQWASSCDGCNKCVQRCPSHAIENRNVNIEACRSYRRALPDGTDCGLCLKVCQLVFEKAAESSAA
jgi:ferredoxin